LGPYCQKVTAPELVVIGKFDGKNGTRRPRTSYLTGLGKWLDPTANENVIMQTSAEREREERDARRDRQ